MTYQKVKTWQEAHALAQEASRVEQAAFAKVQEHLALLLNEAEPVAGKVQGKPFYTSQMRAKAVLQGATEVELKRVMKVINGMLAAFE